MKIRLCFITVVATFLFLILSSSEAALQTIEATGSYTLLHNSEGSFADAEEFARMEAQRSAAEQAAVYIESYSGAEDFVLTKDEITALTAHIMQIEKEGVSKKILDSGDIKFTVKIRATIDPEASDLEAILQNRAQFQKILQNYHELQLRYEEQKRLNEKLKTEIAENQNIGKKDAVEFQQQKKENQTQFQVTSVLKKALAFESSGNVDEALRCFREVLQLNPHESVAYIGIGNAYITKKQYNEAIEILEQGVELFPQNVRIFTRLALAYAYSKEYDKAITNVNHAIEIDDRKGTENFNPSEHSDVAAAYEALGDIYYLMVKNQEALEAYKHALSLAPTNNAKLYVRIGLTYDKMGEYQQAVNEMEHGLAVDPKFFEYSSNNYLWLGKCYLYMENSPKALEYLTKEIQLNLPGTALDLAYYLRSATYAMLNQRNNALDDLEKAVVLRESLHNISDEDIAGVLLILVEEK